MQNKYNFKIELTTATYLPDTKILLECGVMILKKCGTYQNWL